MSDIREIPDGSQHLVNQAQQLQQNAKDAVTEKEKPGETTKFFRVPKDRFEETRMEHKADEVTGEKKLKRPMATEVPAEPDQYQPHEMAYKRDIKEENSYTRGDHSITDDTRHISEEAAKGTKKHDRLVSDNEVIKSNQVLKRDIVENKIIKKMDEPEIRQSKEPDLKTAEGRPAIDSLLSADPKKTALEQSREQLLANAKIRYLSIEQGIRESVERKNEDIAESLASQSRRGKTVAEAAQEMLQQVIARADQKLAELDLHGTRKENQKDQVEERDAFHEKIKTKDSEETLRERKSQTILFATLTPPKIHSSPVNEIGSREAAGNKLESDTPQVKESEIHATSQPENSGAKGSDVPLPKPIMPRPWNAGVPDLLAALAKAHPVEMKDQIERNPAEEIVKALKKEGVFGISANGRNHSVSEFFKLKQFEYDLEEIPLTNDSLLMETENAIFKTLSNGKNDGSTQSLLRAAEAINAYRNELARHEELPHATRPVIHGAPREIVLPKEQLDHGPSELQRD